MKVLSLDTSSKALSIAILENQELLAEMTLNIKKNHSITLMSSIDFLMSSLDMAPQDLERIVVAQGPGSYTGLRVAVATAKTLAYSLQIDLVGISSLQALALAVDVEGMVVPVMDARRNNVYAGFYENGSAIAEDRHAALATVLTGLKNQPQVMFVGEVAPFIQQIKEQLPQASVRSVLPSAFEIGKLGQRMTPVDKHAFVPDYLKKVEAEEKWLESHSESHLSGDYVKRV